MLNYITGEVWKRVYGMVHIKLSQLKSEEEISDICERFYHCGDSVEYMNSPEIVELKEHYEDVFGPNGERILKMELFNMAAKIINQKHRKQLEDIKRSMDEPAEEIVKKMREAKRKAVSGVS